MSSSINASMASDTAAPATPAPPETLCASQVESNDCVRYAACTWNGAACSVSTPEEEEDGDDGSVLYIIIIVVLSLGCLMMLGLLVYCTKQSEKQKEKDRKLYEKEQELLKRADQQMQDEMKNLEHAHVALEAKDKEATALREEVSQRNNYIAEQAEIMQTNNRVKWEAEEALRNYVWLEDQKMIAAASTSPEEVVISQQSRQSLTNSESAFTEASMASEAFAGKVQLRRPSRTPLMTAASPPPFNNRSMQSPPPFNNRSMQSPPPFNNRSLQSPPPFSNRSMQSMPSMQSMLAGQSPTNPRVHKRHRDDPIGLAPPQASIAEDLTAFPSAPTLARRFTPTSLQSGALSLSPPNPPRSWPSSSSRQQQPGLKPLEQVLHGSL